MKKNRHLQQPSYYRACSKKFLRIMKLTTLLLSFAICSAFAGNSYSQNTRLKLDAQNVTIKDVLTMIENQSEFFFLYSSKMIDVNRKVDISSTDKKLSDILDEILTGTDIQYVVRDRQIMLLNKEFTNTGDLQQIKITGTVTDENGPLPGVNIQIEGTTIGAISDINGTYSLLVPNQNAVLIFSYVGYTSQKVSVSGMSVIDIKLVTDFQNLDEVVVVGYGTQKKAALTSSVSVVKGEEISKVQVRDVSNSIAGKAPGLIIRNFNAEPGKDASAIFVRGISTTGDNAPLIVVDGIPGRDISLVDITDVESVTLLKDASAIAPFGARGANGVILITTKRGKQGKPTISFSTYYGIEKPTRLPQFCSSANYARMMNEANRNVGAPETFSADEISKYEAANSPEYPNTDWWNEMMEKNPLQSQNNLSVSGGSENVSYYLSMGAFRQDGYFNNTDFKKYNFRGNIDAAITKSLKVSFDILGYTGDKNNPVDGIQKFLETPARTPNIYPVRNSLDQYVFSGVTEVNQAASLELGGYNRDLEKSFNGTMTVQYTPDFIPGLTLKGLGVYDAGNNFNKLWSTPFSMWRLIDRVNAVYEEVPPATKPFLGEQVTYLTNKQFEFHANYTRKIADNHTVSALFVFNRTEWDGNNLEGKRINYVSSSIDQIFAGPQQDQSTGGSAYEGARMGYVGRLTYDYKSKYLVEGNFRYDGSMKFAQEKRWGFFPSFALGWRVSEESFFKNNISFVNNLKIRGSWGQAGNDRVGDYQYLATYGYQDIPYSFGGVLVQTAKEARLANPDITWETATLTDLGFDLSMLKGKITLEADYFFKRTEDILRPTQKTSSIIGINLPDENIGIVENKGFEFILGHKNRLNDFTYGANLVFTYAKNKAIELGEAEGTLNDPIRRRTGNTLNAYYGLISEGLFTSADEIADWAYQGESTSMGDIKYRDINGPEGTPDGLIDGYDETKIGYSYIPEIIYGLNLEAAYKGFDLSVNLQGATHVNYYFTFWGANAFDTGGNIQQWQMDERWTSENNNPGARYPRLTPAPIANNTMASDYWLRDGTYLRLKTLQLGYNIPKPLLQKAKLEGLRIYVSGQNLFTWVKDDLMTFDPEAYEDRGSFYPQAKVYSLGLKLTF
jgi:TonB-linked SusC/RagA family outer membrane protein